MSKSVPKHGPKMQKVSENSPSKTLTAAVIRNECRDITNTIIEMLQAARDNPRGTSSRDAKKKIDSAEELVRNEMLADIHDIHSDDELQSLFENSIKKKLGQLNSTLDLDAFKRIKQTARIGLTTLMQVTFMDRTQYGLVPEIPEKEPDDNSDIIGIEEDIDDEPNETRQFTEFLEIILETDDPKVHAEYVSQQLRKFGVQYFREFLEVLSDESDLSLLQKISKKQVSQIAEIAKGYIEHIEKAIPIPLPEHDEEIEQILLEASKYTPESTWQSSLGQRLLKDFQGWVPDLLYQRLARIDDPQDLAESITQLSSDAPLEISEEMIINAFVMHRQSSWTEEEMNVIKNKLRKRAGAREKFIQSISKSLNKLKQHTDALNSEFNGGYSLRSPQEFLAISQNALLELEERNEQIHQEVEEEVVVLNDAKPEEVVEAIDVPEVQLPDPSKKYYRPRIRVGDRGREITEDLFYKMQHEAEMLESRFTEVSKGNLTPQMAEKLEIEWINEIRDDCYGGSNIWNVRGLSDAIRRGFEEIYLRKYFQEHHRPQDWNSDTHSRKYNILSNIEEQFYGKQLPRFARSQLRTLIKAHEEATVLEHYLRGIQTTSELERLKKHPSLAATYVLSTSHADASKEDSQVLHGIVFAIVASLPANAGAMPQLPVKDLYLNARLEKLNGISPIVVTTPKQPEPVRQIQPKSVESKSVVEKIPAPLNDLQSGLVTKMNELKEKLATSNAISQGIDNLDELVHKFRAESERCEEEFNTTEEGSQFSRMENLRSDISEYADEERAQEKTNTELEAALLRIGQHRKLLEMRYAGDILLEDAKRSFKEIEDQKATLQQQKRSAADFVAVMQYLENASGRSAAELLGSDTSGLLEEIQQLDSTIKGLHARSQQTKEALQDAEDARSSISRISHDLNQAMANIEKALDSADEYHEPSEEVPPVQTKKLSDTSVPTKVLQFNEGINEDDIFRRAKFAVQRSGGFESIEVPLTELQQKLLCLIFVTPSNTEVSFIRGPGKSIRNLTRYYAIAFPNEECPSEEQVKDALDAIAIHDPSTKKGNDRRLPPNKAERQKIDGLVFRYAHKKKRWGDRYFATPHGIMHILGNLSEEEGDARVRLREFMIAEKEEATVFSKPANLIQALESVLEDIECNASDFEGYNGDLDALCETLLETKLPAQELEYYKKGQRFLASFEDLVKKPLVEKMKDMIIGRYSGVYLPIEEEE